MRDFSYHICEHIGTISTSGDIEKAVKMIAYNGGIPKVDIRSWRGDHMLKGIVLTVEEAKELRKILERIE